MPESAEQLGGVTGHCTSLKGPGNTQLIKDMIKIHHAFTDDMGNLCIIWLDYLISIMCRLDLVETEMAIHSVKPEGFLKSWKDPDREDLDQKLRCHPFAVCESCLLQSGHSCVG